MRETNSILRHLPNFLTLTSIILGCLSIKMAFERNFIFSSYFIFAAAIFDFFDGFAARRLNASSEFGKSLDSLADMINFGVAPSFMMYQLLIMSRIMSNPTFSLESVSFVDGVILYSSFLIPVFAAIRLARFNTRVENGSFFRGMPSPAAGLLIASITLLFAQTENETIRNLVINTTFLLIVIFGISILMVARFKAFSLKFENFSLSKENQLRYLFLTASLALIVFLQYIGIPLIIILYLILSLVTGLKSSQE